MKLQLALDRLSKGECLKISKETQNYIDWIEIGTGVIKEYGMSIVREMKEKFPDKVLVADMKTCDAGKHEAIQAFEAGADITTVMAFSADRTIKDTLEVSRDYGARVMIDLLGISTQQRINELINLGVDLVSLHYGKDMQQDGSIHLNLFDLIRSDEKLDVTVAGGINLDTLPAIIRENPSVVIVGSAITKANNPAAIARKMKGFI
ncbi:3-hexulose-6-phosphate synthase [Aquibacillus albus]|uniref:3-hexulose-6-phosphate synthase n=1 Tax=Aquibacillus albus TaxID=1168171 RepID=A0ABS2N632_9BACI|nr:3-hexulose-6-phosphate synthase [Aquibacillus albus]MBM7573582.1 3-hexulose-6-phosphate synthase [Aquibacillus albus]